MLADLNREFLDPRHAGHVDAKCVYLGENRFRAIPFYPPLREEEIECMRNELNIPADQIAWDIVEQREENQGLDFPVLKREGGSDRGASLSNVSIPLHRKSWVYVAPQYEMALRNVLVKKVGRGQSDASKEL